MAGEIQRPQEKAESDSLALPYGLERVEGAKQKAEERWARIPIHAEPPPATDAPRAAPEGAASDRDRPALLDPHDFTRRGARPPSELPPKLARAKPALEQKKIRANR